MQKKKKSKSTQPKGKSKYALKCEQRRKAALALGFPGNTPWPVIWAWQKS